MEFLSSFFSSKQSPGRKRLESLDEGEDGGDSTANLGGEKGDYSIVDGVLKSKSDLTCEDMYLLDCEQAYAQLRKRKHRRDKTACLNTIAVLGWFGCDKLMLYANKSGLLQYIVVLLRETIKISEEAFLNDQIVEHKDVKDLQFSILRAIAVYVRGSHVNQDMLRNNGGLNDLVDLLNDDNEIIRKWSCHALFVALLNNGDNQTEIITIPSLVSKLNDLKKETWNQYWDGNQALLLMKVLGWHDVAMD